MADTKITGLAALLAAGVATGDLFDIVDVSDTSMAGSGTNKKITAADLATAVGALLSLAATYQPLDSDLTAIAALTTTSFGRALLALADAAALRTAAGLGTASTLNSGTGAGDLPTKTQADGLYQPLDSDLTAIAALSTTSYGRAFLALADAAAARTAIGVDASGTAVLKTLYDANTILAATTDDTPAALTVGASTIVGRKSSGGIVALTAAEALALIAAVDDTAYDATSWNGVTTIAPSKNAVRDEVEALLAALQPLDADLTSIAALATTSYGRGLLTLADAAAARASFGNRVLDEAHADAGVANSTAEQTLATLVLPSGITAVGDTVRFTAFGDFLNNSGSAVTYTWRLKIGSTTLFTSNAISLSASANRGRWKVDADFEFPTTATERVGALLSMAGGANTWGVMVAANCAVGYGTASEDTAGALNVILTCQLGTAVSTTDIILHGASLQMIKK